MRKGLLVAGIIVLVLGVLLAAYGFAVLNTSSVTIPGNGSVEEFSVPSVGSAGVTISWSGAPSGTTVNVVQCENACQTLGSETAAGSGSTGSVSFTASSGTTYGIYATGASNGVPSTVKVTGITILDLIGIVLLVLGAVLALLGVRMKARAPRPEPMAAPMPAAVDAPADDDVTVVAPPPSQAAVAPVAGQRANLTCSHCGTVNEPWLTNCRKCKRPLTSTGA